MAISSSTHRFSFYWSPNFVSDLLRSVIKLVSFVSIQINRLERFLKFRPPGTIQWLMAMLIPGESLFVQQLIVKNYTIPIIKNVAQVHEFSGGNRFCLGALSNVHRCANQFLTPYWFEFQGLTPVKKLDFTLGRASNLT